MRRNKSSTGGREGRQKVVVVEEEERKKDMRLSQPSVTPLSDRSMMMKDSGAWQDIEEKE